MEGSILVARQCFISLLRDQLRDHITNELDAKDKDLVVGVPCEFIEMDGTSMGLAFLFTLVSTGGW